MIILKCDQDIETLGIRNPGGWNILAFWDHLDSCVKCREARMALLEELNKEIGGEQEFFGILSNHG